MGTRLLRNPYDARLIGYGCRLIELVAFTILPSERSRIAQATEHSALRVSFASLSVCQVITGHSEELELTTVGFFLYQLSSRSFFFRNLFSLCLRLRSDMRPRL